MWQERMEKRFFWASTEKDLEKLLYELIKAEEEEDTGIYLLLMYHDHAAKRLPFTPGETEKIRQSLSVLIEESRKHQKLLQDAISKLEQGKLL